MKRERLKRKPRILPSTNKAKKRKVLDEEPEESEDEPEESEEPEEEPEGEPEESEEPKEPEREPEVEPQKVLVRRKNRIQSKWCK